MKLVFNVSQLNDSVSYVWYVRSACGISKESDPTQQFYLRLNGTENPITTRPPTQSAHSYTVSTPILVSTSSSSDHRTIAPTTTIKATTKLTTELPTFTFTSTDDNNPCQEGNKLNTCHSN